MGVVIERDVWEPNPTMYLFIFVSCCLSVFCLPIKSNSGGRSSSVFDHAPPSSFIRFQRRFLLLFSLSSVMEGLWEVFGEYEMAYNGISREQMIVSLCLGYVAALFGGIFLGMLSDLIGQKKVCLLFCSLHLFIAIWKRVTADPSVWLASICLSLASTIFFFNFETGMVVEHDKLGQRQDLMNDMFWLMTFAESASFIGSQVLGNWLIGGNGKRSMLSPSGAVVVLAFIALIHVSRRWKEDPKSTSLKDYHSKFHTYILSDRRIWLLSWAQASVHFSVSVFWILWAPTIVADGREVLLGLIYPCLLGAKMLGSTAFPWFFNGPLLLRTEDCLVYAFVVMGFVMSIVAYDYQEIKVLVMLFSIFHACMGLVLPSFARLRTMYILCALKPVKERRIWMRGCYLNIENLTMIAAAALGLFSAAGCMYMLKRLGKQPHQNWHKL
uniref:Molybdate-anion transporter-like isoform X2 n=1 Tax=Nicotiana sylvestris TaxID=4096 RepID=A0A1U7X107_NICSY|nr:PREDICTED: molybdate-anion transporter-like isoform X2 [Nicotiana sylvestris]